MINTKKDKRKAVKQLYTLAVIIGMASIYSLLYPYISDTWNRYAVSKTVTDYNKQVEEVVGEEVDYTAILENAKAYNAELFAAGDNHIAEYTERASGESREAQLNGDVDFPDTYYESFLSFSDDGMMGYISIKKINVLLPIKHYTTSEVLATSIGHLYGSSLPVGGESTHSVLTGHSALISARLFTDLEKLIVGDKFSITVAGKTLNYQVDQIKTVLPEELDDLTIEEGKDYVTLVTCTPYAVNTHRLLVRGCRIADDADMTVKKDTVAQVREFVELPVTMFIIVGSIFALGVILIICIWLKKDKNNNNPDGPDNNAKNISDNASEENPEETLEKVEKNKKSIVEEEIHENDE